MKRAFFVIVAAGLLSTGPPLASLAFAGSAQADSRYQATARLSLGKPYDGSSPRIIDTPAEGTWRRVSYRQENQPARFNILRYVRAGNEGLEIAVYFK